ncbi:hypothetical protein [Ectobacillus panaciterrae]|uniref:hypothetical protein n=1 Tax=Ectobacillus panaciterrae TaxID=363872 RepID=UPI0004281DBB|nr:hypothetical protein [Ectobacillus panaciterrae]
MALKTNSFKTSVNIKFDLGKEEFVNRYLPTPSHAESLLGLLRGFNNPANLRSHIIVGPYGTGKSLIATIVGSVVSKELNKKTTNSLVCKFDKVHDEIFDELSKAKDIEKKFLTVALNGNEGSFRQAVLSAIIHTLNEHNVDIILPGQSGKIIETLDLWKLKFPKTYKDFKKTLITLGKDFHTFRLEVLTQDKEAIEWFISMYPTLTSGAEFIIDYKQGFVEQIKSVLEQLNKKNLGLFIAYDEFGRLLQTLETHEIHETMQDLQDLAELTDHHSDNIHLLLITHRNLGQYFSLFTDEFKNEFQRIEKRFKTYYVESDRYTFIRLADNVLHEIDVSANIDQHTKEELVKYLRKYPLFPELNQQEIERLVIEGVYPIHPVTLYLLPHLSSLFGQNERTLFTFLESQDSGGLRNHMSKRDSHYLPFYLFQYFFPSVFDVDTSKEEYASLKVYKNLITRIPDIDKGINSGGHKNLIQFITLWQLVGLQSKFKLTTEFLSFALNINMIELEKIMEELVKLKAVRYNRVLEYWELLEGSSFHLENLIQDKSLTLNTTRAKRINVLGHVLPKRFYFANEYNDEKSLTRYANVQVVFSSDVIADKLTVELTEHNKSDATIYYILLEENKQYDEVLAKVQQFKSNLSIFVLNKTSYQVIQQPVNELVAIETLLEDVELLKEDKNLQQELLLKKEDLKFEVDNYMSCFTSYTPETIWIYNSEIMDIRSEMVLEEELSNLMFKFYPYTPEVTNDSFNRRFINNIQRKAGYKVLDHVINEYQDENFGIEGQGPDYLIYATIFKNNQLNLIDLENISNENFKMLRNALKEKLEKETRGKLSGLVNIMRSQPFGIREPLIPIYLVSLLRDKWDDMMFYRNEMYVAGVNGEKFYQMVNEADEYEYVYHELEETYQNFFNELDRLFIEYANDLVKNKPKVIILNNAMLSWLRSLPRITQITNILPKDIIKFKEVIKRSEINPQEALMALYNIYRNDFKLLEKHKLHLEKYFYNFREEVEMSIFSITEKENLDDLLSWAKQQNSLLQKQNKMINNLVKLEIREEWIDIFAYNFTGVELSNWSDTTYDLFQRQIVLEYDEVLNNDVNNIKQDHTEIKINGTVKIVKNVELSTKSNTIYSNIQRMVKNAGRNVPKEEVEFMIYKLLDEFID